MPQVVVDDLEAVNIDHDQRQGALVARRTGDLAVEEFEEVALVERLGESVHDREAIDLLVILRLDIAADEEAVNAIADAEVVAVLELVHRRGDVVDVRAVGALQVHRIVAVGARLNAGVSARHRMIVDADFAVAGAADDDGLFTQRIARAHARAGGINMDEAGVAARHRDGPFDPSDPGFGHPLR